MEKPRSYREVLDSLKLPPDVPKIITCRFCGEPLHLTKINSLICFWLHRGKSIKICAEKNPANKGKPVALRNMNVYKNIKELWSKMTKKEG